MYSSDRISEIIGADVIGHSTSFITSLLIDSRQLTEPSETVFIALSTNRNDGHQYIDGLIQKGVKTFIVDHIPDTSVGVEEICFLVVQDTLKALQQLAAYHRQQFHIPVIGITGSNGKTIVKEWLYQLLKSDYSISRSPKSYNSQVGVPLSVWPLTSQHTLGIYEAGISQTGEMHLLKQIIQPTLGVFTSLGSAHDEGFKNITQKLKEKLQLFENCEFVVINALDFDRHLLAELPTKNTCIISREDKADLRILDVHTHHTTTTVNAIYQHKNVQITIPFTDSASIMNAITCWGVLLYFKLEPAEIERRMPQLQSVAMRLELKSGSNHCVLINDFYNSDIHALEIALHHQKQQQRGGKKIVILSDIEQSGKSSEELYTLVARLIKQFQIDTLIGIGHEISSQQKLFTTPAYFFEDTLAFISESKRNPELQFHHSIILLKGARSFGFERISQFLQQKSHDTVLEIDLNKLVHNLNFYRSQITKQTRLMCMVKATGYGSGSTEIAFTLQHHQVDYLAVAYADEGVELRKAGIHLPIMVMSPEESSYDDMIDYQLEPELYSVKIVHEFLQALQHKAIAEPYPVHIKLDTGMHRLGFEEDDMDQLCVLLKKETTLKVKTLFSHLVGSDDKSLDDFSNHQIALFETMASRIEDAIGYTALKHICNSGAITRFKNAHYDMVRLGIGMYGVGFNALEKQHLQNISSLKTRISQIKHLKKGDTVGYSRKGVATHDMRIATIPIGYADGFSRKLGNGNFYVWIHQTACITMGNICMDMCMVDITNVPCEEGDEVVIFETNHQLMELSTAMETIPYEVLTSISTRVKRVYVQE